MNRESPIAGGSLFPKRHMTGLTRIILAIVAATGATPPGYRASAPTATSPWIVTVGFSTEKAMGGETVTGTIRQVGPVFAQDQVFRLSSNPPSLLKFTSTPEVVLRANQTSATFTFTLIPSTIKTAVTVTAVAANGIGTSGTIQIFPALIKTVRLSAPSMVGTHGAVVTATVELNAPAPSGGVELYPFMTFTTGTNTVRKTELSLASATPRVAAGSRALAVPIAYDALRTSEALISRNVEGARQVSTTENVFNAETAHIELVMAVEPQTVTTAASPTPGISSRHTIDVIPFRIVSSAAQPSSVVGGAEAVGTFTLSAPSGPNEVVVLSPISTAAPAWARPTGVACNATVQTRDGRSIMITLTPGATSQSFRICTSATTVPDQHLTVLMRSGQFTVPITVRLQ